MRSCLKLLSVSKFFLPRITDYCKKKVCGHFIVVFWPSSFPKKEKSWSLQIILLPVGILLQILTTRPVSTKLDVKVTLLKASLKPYL